MWYKSLRLGFPFRTNQDLHQDATLAVLDTTGMYTRSRKWPIKSFSDEKNIEKLHFPMSWVNSRCDRMLPSFFHWTLEIHLRLPSINELGSASQFPNTDVEKLKETQKTAVYLVCSGHRRRVASVLGGHPSP